MPYSSSVNTEIRKPVPAGITSLRSVTGSHPPSSFPEKSVFQVKIFGGPGASDAPGAPNVFTRNSHLAEDGHGERDPIMDMNETFLEGTDSEDRGVPHT